MHFPHSLFKSAGLNSTDVAYLFGVSRVTGYRWLQETGRNGAPGVGVNVFLQRSVVKVVPALTRAVESGALPDAALARLPPKKRATKIKSIISQYRTTKK